MSMLFTACVSASDVVINKFLSHLTPCKMHMVGFWKHDCAQLALLWIVTRQCLFAVAAANDVALRCS